MAQLELVRDSEYNDELIESGYMYFDDLQEINKSEILASCIMIENLGIDRCIDMLKEEVANEESNPEV